MVEIKAFICGGGHSGTTIVARIMGTHPEVFWPAFETRIFLAEYQKAQWDYLAILSVAAKSGKRALIEKTPHHLYRLDLIRKIVPGAKFIIMVRDGRDVAASFIKRYGNAEAGIQRWLEEARISLREKDRPDVLLVRYEDFVSDPAVTIDRICSFIGLTVHPAMLDFYKQPVMWGKQIQLRKGTGLEGPEHTALRNWQVNQPIFDGRGIWKDQLSPEQIAEIEDGLGRALMQAFGYLAP